jgi:hypothetical protein
MAVMKSDILRADPNAHGHRPFSYKLEIAKEQAVSAINLLGGTDELAIGWQPIPARVDACQIGYGADPYEMQFVAYDAATTEAEHSVPLTIFRKPKIGDFVLLTIYDATAPAGRILHRGTIRSLHEKISNSGIEYVCTSISEVSRLNDFHVTMNANLRNDPINPTPRFDANGKMLEAKLKTVTELLKEVFSFRDAWNSDQFFSYTDIVWPERPWRQTARCGAYTPSNISYENTKKGQALEDLLQTGRQLHTSCTCPLAPAGARSEWSSTTWRATAAAISGPSSWVVGTNNDLYAHNFTVEEDNSEWNTRDTANVARVTTGPIRFYSGNFLIPEIYTDTDDSGAATRNVVVVDNDDVDSLHLRANSLDATNYRFTFPVATTNDNRPKKIFPVGMPLFPDWNPHEDFLPALVEVLEVLPPSGSAFDKATYPGTVEWAPYTVGDECARGTPRPGHIDNLHVYQAWHSESFCPACNGSGLVQKVYNNAENEPTFDWFAVGASGRRTINPWQKPLAGEKIVYQVNNYIYDPRAFGSGGGPSGLQPYDLAGASSYPRPWKNLCPYCRGVGLKPEYKIREIQGELFAGRNNQIAPTGATPSGMVEYRTDPDFTQIGPETYDETQNRVAIREGAYLVTETYLTGTVLPDFDQRNKSWHDIKALNASQRRFKFENPLKFTNLKKILIQKVGMANTDPRAKIVPDNWTVEVPFTTINYGQQPDFRIDPALGRVLFTEPFFVPCRKQFTQYVKIEGGRYLLDDAGMLKPRSLGRGTLTADREFQPTGYWRPAKAWLTFFYTRPNFYDYMFKDPSGNAINYTEFTATSPEGKVETYRARTSIHDGRLVIELKKVYPNANEFGGANYPSGYRTIQVAFTDNESRVETWPSDLWKMQIPSIVDATPAALETYKTSVKHLDFPRGRILKYERTTPGEQQLENDGYVAKDYANSLMRPKMFSFRMRDDRSRLLAKLVRILEGANNLQVSGTMKLRGVSHTIEKGLGFVDKPNKGKAGIKRIQYSFSGGGMVAEVELSREEARTGETIPKDEDLMHNVQKDQVELKRLIDQLRANQNMGQQLSINTGGDLSSGTGLYRSD